MHLSGQYSTSPNSVLIVTLPRNEWIIPDVYTYFSQIHCHSSFLREKNCVLFHHVGWLILPLSAEKILRDHLTVYFGSAEGDKRPHCAAEWFCRALSKCKHANTWLKTNLIQIDFRFCSCCDQHLLYYMAIGGEVYRYVLHNIWTASKTLCKCVRWVHDSVPWR